MKRKAEYRVGVGASSILMILVVLALAALSLLSLKAAQNNAALTARNLDMTLSYYRAAADVQRTLAAMDESRYELDLSSDGGLAAFQTYLKSQKTPVTLSEDMDFTLTADAGAEREIIVEGTVIPGKTGGLSITRHELGNTAAFSEETDRLTVFLP
jgi:hypothetical protein